MYSSIEITPILVEAIHELNSISAPEFRIDPVPESILLKSRGGKLDSLGLVNLVVITERKLAEKAGKSISLCSAETFTALNEEIHSFQDFRDYICKRI